MKTLSENCTEQSFIDQLVTQGYLYFNGVNISPISSVILENHFKQ